MAHIAANLKDKEDSKDFADLLSESMGDQKSFTGSVVNGTVVRVDNDFVMVDVLRTQSGRHC